MAIKLSQIDKDELRSFINQQLLQATLAGLVDCQLGPLQEGETLMLVGDPPVWKNYQLSKQVYLTEDGLRVVAGSPPTKELLAVDQTVARRNTQNNLTLPVSGKSKAPIVFSSRAPGFIFNQADAKDNEAVYRFFASGGNLSFDIRNDGNTTSKNWLFVKRNGMTIEQIDLCAERITVNGKELVTQDDLEALIARIEQLED